MPRLRAEERSEAIGMLRARISVSQIANHFRVIPKTIYRLKARFQATGSVKDRPRSGRPRVTTIGEDRHIRTTHLRNRFQSASDTSRQFRQARPVSRWTISRRLRAAGIRARLPAQRILLQPHHCIARLNWARLHQRWAARHWDNVVFSDECRFQMDSNDARRRVYRSRNERYLPNCVSTVGDKRGVMVWGAISSTDHSPLVIINGNLTAARYINEVVRPHLLPFLARNGNPTFQQDNAPAHRARLTNGFLNQNGVNVLRPWPAISPDLNPIEHVWDQMKRKLRSLHPPPRTLPQLRAALVNIWTNIPQANLTNLVHSMRRRCTAVVNANGSYTRY